MPLDSLIVRHHRSEFHYQNCTALCAASPRCSRDTSKTSFPLRCLRDLDRLLICSIPPSARLASSSVNQACPNFAPAPHQRFRWAFPVVAPPPATSGTRDRTSDTPSSLSSAPLCCTPHLGALDLHTSTNSASRDRLLALGWCCMSIPPPSNPPKQPLLLVASSTTSRTLHPLLSSPLLASPSHPRSHSTCRNTRPALVRVIVPVLYYS